MKRLPFTLAVLLAVAACATLHVETAQAQTTVLVCNDASKEGVKFDPATTWPGCTDTSSAAPSDSVLMMAMNAAVETMWQRGKDVAQDSQVWSDSDQRFIARPALTNWTTLPRVSFAANVTWTPPTTTVDNSPLEGANALTEFRVYKANSEGASVFASADSPHLKLPTTAVSHRHSQTDALSGTTFYAGVRACNLSGCSALSPVASKAVAAPQPINVATFAPGVPTALVANVTAGNVKLDWVGVFPAMAAEYEGTHTEGFNVYRSTGATLTAANKVGSASIPGTTPTWTDAAVPNGDYYYGVSAWRCWTAASGVAEGCSESAITAALAVTVTPAPAVPNAPSEIKVQIAAIITALQALLAKL